MKSALDALLAALAWLTLVFLLAAVAASCSPAHAAEPGQAAVSVQVSSEGRIAVITLYDVPCEAPSAIRTGAQGLYSGFVVFDPTGPFQPGTRPPDAVGEVVPLCWAQRGPLVALIMYRVAGGVESATDPVVIPADQFQIIRFQ